MESSLAPMLARIFIEVLEGDLVTKISKHIRPWTRCAHYKIMYMESGCISKVIDILNNFHENLKSTHELKDIGQISFLDILRDNSLPWINKWFLFALGVVCSPTL